MALQTIIKGNGARKMSLEAFAVKLLDKIVQAPYPEAIDRYIGVAVKAMNSKKINGYIIQRFIDRVGLYLDDHQPANPRQEENTTIARKRLQQFRQQVAQPVNA